MSKKISLAVRVLAAAVLFLALPSQDVKPAESAAADIGPVANGALPGPFPLFPPTNWWNLDVTTAPVDPNSAGFISFINNGGTRHLHPDFGGDVSPGSVEIYGMPYIVVDGTQTKLAVQFLYSDESDGVDHSTDTSYPFYPIPDQAITQPHWIEGGWPGNQDQRSSNDRHMLIVDRDNKYLYELYNVFYDGTRWLGGSGAFFDMNTNNRRPDGWTSADAAGLAILPGLVRYDEVSGPDEIGHAFRVTVRATNGYVYPASHRAGSASGALPMGARLRLKASKNISSFPADAQKIFRAMKKYGLIVADNGSDMYITGTYDTRWNNDVLNPAFAGLVASDFEVITLGYDPPAATPTATQIPATTPTATRRPRRHSPFRRRPPQERRPQRGHRPPRRHSPFRRRLPQERRPQRGRRPPPLRQLRHPCRPRQRSRRPRRPRRRRGARSRPRHPAERLFWTPGESRTYRLLDSPGPNPRRVAALDTSENRATPAVGSRKIAGADQELADDLAAGEDERLAEELSPLLAVPGMVGVQPSREGAVTLAQ